MAEQLVWMKVTRDKFELPVAVADTCVELAAILGVSENSIRTAICNSKRQHYNTVYRRVVINDKD
jgi:hypothetical protein